MMQTPPRLSTMRTMVGSPHTRIACLHPFQRGEPRPAQTGDLKKRRSPAAQWGTKLFFAAWRRRHTKARLAKTAARLCAGYKHKPETQNRPQPFRCGRFSYFKICTATIKSFLTSSSGALSRCSISHCIIFSFSIFLLLVLTHPLFLWYILLS